jgi:hypothetical protein
VQRADNIYRVFRSHYGNLFGGLFGEGNVAEAYDNFHLQHVCNVFCHFFELPSILEPEPNSDEENELKAEGKSSINVKLEEVEETGKFAGLGATADKPIVFVDESNDLYE